MNDIVQLKNNLESVKREIEDKNRNKAAAQSKLSDTSKLNGSELDHYTRQLKSVVHDIENIEKKRDELETKIESEAAKM